MNAKPKSAPKTQAIFRKRPARSGEVGFFPVDEQAVELFGKVPGGRDVGIGVHVHRNPRHHRLYWAIVRFVRMHAVTPDGEPLFENADDEIIHAAVKIATGFVKTFIDTTTGKTALVPLSISWASMDQLRFNEFFQRACDTVAQRWMPAGVTSDDVRRELIKMVDGEHALPEMVA